MGHTCLPFASPISNPCASSEGHDAIVNVTFADSLKEHVYGLLQISFAHPPQITSQISKKVILLKISVGFAKGEGSKKIYFKITELFNFKITLKIQKAKVISLHLILLLFPTG